MLLHSILDVSFDGQDELDDEEDTKDDDSGVDEELEVSAFR